MGRGLDEAQPTKLALTRYCCGCGQFSRLFHAKLNLSFQIEVWNRGLRCCLVKIECLLWTFHLS